MTVWKMFYMFPYTGSVKLNWFSLKQRGLKKFKQRQWHIGTLKLRKYIFPQTIPNSYKFMQIYVNPAFSDYLFLAAFLEWYCLVNQSCSVFLGASRPAIRHVLFRITHSLSASAPIVIYGSWIVLFYTILKYNNFQRIIYFKFWKLYFCESYKRFYVV